MKTTLKVALLASVLMAMPAFAADKSDADYNANGKHLGGRAMDNVDNEKLDANGNPVHRKHWRHHRKSDMDSDNADATNKRRGWRDADGNWHAYNRGNYVANDGRTYGYNDYYNRNGRSELMGIDLHTRHMTDGADTDVNNRGRHAFIFGDNQNPQDFRVGTGHVVKF